MCEKILLTETYKETIRKILRDGWYITCDCGCKVSTKYPFYGLRGEKFVRCDCCKKLIELRGRKE